MLIKKASLLAFAANDVCADANTMNVGSSYDGTINPLGDIDWGKWYVAEAGTLRIDLDVPSGKDYELAVYSACSKLECLSAHGSSYDEYCVLDGNIQSV